MKKGEKRQFVHILLSHRQDGGNQIVAVCATRKVAMGEWKKEPSFETDRQFGTGHSIKRFRVRFGVK